MASCASPALAPGGPSSSERAVFEGLFREPSESNIVYCEDVVWHERRRGAAVAKLGAGTDVGNQHVSLFSAGRAIHCRYTSFPQELLELLEGVAAFAGQIGEVFYERVVPHFWSNSSSSDCGGLRNPQINLARATPMTRT